MGSVTMVGQVVVTVPPDSHTDEPAKRIRRMLQAFRCMLGVQIENRARVGLLRPWQETLVVFLDQADGAVDKFHIVPPVILANFRQKGFQRISRYVNLDRKSTRLNSSHQIISYAVFCLKKKKNKYDIKSK